MNTPVAPLARIQAALQGRRILLTGHTGFKGSWLALWLNSLGAEVHGLALDPPAAPALFDLAHVKSALASDQRIDIRNAAEVTLAVQAIQPAVAFHLAALPLVRTSYEQPAETFHVNVGGTANVLDALRKVESVRAIVVVTTDKVYENREWAHAYREADPLGGHDPYSASKAAAEIVTASFAKSFFSPRGVGLATARAGNVIGGGDWAKDRIVPDMVRALTAGQAIPVRNPQSTRPWQHVLEPLYGYLLLAAALTEDARQFSGAWNFAPAVDSGRPVRDLVATFLQAWGSGRWEDLSAQQTNAPHEAGRLALAWEKAYLQLGWKPAWDFHQTIARTAGWYRDQHQGADAAALCATDIAQFGAALTALAASANKAAGA